MTPRQMLWRAAKALTVVGASYWLALPQVPRALSGVQLLNDRGLALPILGAVLAIGAVWAYAQVTRLLFEQDDRPGSWLTLGIVVAALGVNRLVPAGAAVGTIVTFKLFGRTGLGRQRTGFVMAAQGLGSNVLLVVLVAMSMMVALPAHGIAPGYVTAAVGVAGYRLSHYWLPIPAAACAYLLVRRHLARRVPLSPSLA